MLTAIREGSVGSVSKISISDDHKVGGAGIGVPFCVRYSLSLARVSTSLDYFALQWQCRLFWVGSHDHLFLTENPPGIPVVRAGVFGLGT